MMDEPVTTAHVLAAWREATRAAELAERLSLLAVDTADRADGNAMASEEIADLAEQAAVAAEKAAARARVVATQAREMARESREQGLGEANATVTAARAVEAEARSQYHAIEAKARGKLQEGAPD